MIALVVIGTFIGGFFYGASSSQNRQSQVSAFTDSWTNTNQAPSCYPRKNVCPRGFRDNPPLIIISLDGFRADYLQKVTTLSHLAECGVRARYMRPVFPTKTFPNHYTIVTGLYPESHGIIGNTIYDPDTGRKFSLKNRLDNNNPEWWEAEPIWVTAVKQGKVTASYFWPGSDIEIKGMTPSYYFKYRRTSWKARIDKTLEWLDLPDNSRPSLITLYFNEPDHTSHRHGPFAQEVEIALEKVEAMFNQLIEGLKARRLMNCVNIIVVGDHGMEKTDCDNVVVLKNYVKPSEVRFLPGTVGRIMPNDKTENSVVNTIEKFRCKQQDLLVYHKNELPKRYHFSANKKIEPIIIDLSAKWTIANSVNPNYCGGGAHGYDNLYSSMNTIFVAYGPSFKRNLVIKPFLVVELYELMSELLHIKPEPNNGTYGSLHHVLRNPAQLPTAASPKAITTCVICSQPTQPGKLSGCSCKRENLNTDTAYIPATTKNDVVLMPWGAPVLKGTDSVSVCHLINPNHITAFHKELKLPIWTSFTLTKETSLFSGTSVFKSGKCWLADGRVPIENLANCSHYNSLAGQYPGLQQRPLFPLAFATQDKSDLSAILMTNAVPLYQQFQSGIWQDFLLLLSKWAQEYGSLNVVMGPVFDVNGNGIRPHIKDLLKTENIPVPTHYFVVVTQCHSANISANACQLKDIEVLSFLIPHHDSPLNCQSSNEYFLKHSARVKDVEIITGLEFFRRLPFYTAIELRTHLVEKLWSV